jgi:hypothetical protein
MKKKHGVSRQERQQNRIPQKWTFGDAWLESPGRTKLGILTVIKQKINVERSLLDDIKTKQRQWYGHVQ